MAFRVLMGVPEMERLWSDLQWKYRSGRATRDESRLYRRWGKAMALLARDPRHPGLHTHEIEPLTRRYGTKVWQSYIENRNSRAMRMYWVYGPGRDSITVIGLEPHPENGKRGAYDKVSLSDLPPLAGDGTGASDPQAQ